MPQPPFTVIVPRWVRVLAFLRVPFARRRVSAARLMERLLAHEADEIFRRQSEVFMDVLLYGYSMRFPEGQPCCSCGDTVAPRVMRSDYRVWCRDCDARRPRFYGPGIGELLRRGEGG